MTVRGVQGFGSAANGRTFDFDLTIEPGENRTALLFVATLLASTNTAEFAVGAGEGWREIGRATTTSTNRRYTLTAWEMPEPAAGARRVRVETARAVSGAVGFLCLVERRPYRAVGAVGAAGALEAAGPFAGEVVYAAVGRGANAHVETDTGQVLMATGTQEADPRQSMTAALMAGGPGTAVRADASGGRLPLLLAVELEPEEPDEPEPPAPPREISVIVRDIPAGGSHEVRHVRPGEIVMGPAGIDWEETPYTAYILTHVQPAA